MKNKKMKTARRNKGGMVKNHRGSRNFSSATGCPLVNEADAGIEWSAKWIAPPGEKHPNYYFLARKEFQIASRPQRALLRIAADGRYAAYLNGKFVGNGPVRGTERRYFADSYDIAALLTPGPNWIAVEVHCSVAPTFTMVPYQPAVLAEIAAIAATDESWQVMVDPSHQAVAPLYTFQIGHAEWKRMDAERPGWMSGRDGHEGWLTPLIAGSPADFGGRRTVARPIAALTQDILHPRTIVASGQVPHSSALIETVEWAGLVAVEAHYPFRKAACHARPPCGGSKPLTVQPAAHREGAYLIFDFGREVFGNLRIEVDGPQDAVMDVAHNDALQDGRINSNPSTSYRFADRFTLRSGQQIIVQRLHNRGFRYLQLVFRNFITPIRLHEVQLINRIYSQEPRAAFTCPDPFLNRLWTLCANTVRACSADTFMDCPWREQALWTNDQAVTNLYYLALTGDPVFSAHNLRMGADGAQPNGLIPPVYPSRIDRMKRLFPSLPSLWTFSLSDYYQHTGDRRLVQELLPVMEKGLGNYDTWRAADGLVPDQGDMWNFIDWAYIYDGGPHPAPGGKTAALNMLIAAAYRRAAALESAEGQASLAAEYDRKSRQAVAALNAVLWDAAKGAYRDCTAFAEGVVPSYSQHPLAVGLYHDLLDDPQRHAAVASLLSNDLIHAEFYFQHYVLQALAQHGRTAEAMAVIRKMWGANVKSDSDTIWEIHSGRKKYITYSLCHAFSCAPLYFLQSVVLGVRPTRPGFAEFTLAPQPADLDKAQGTVPTPHGLIEVAWRRTGPGKLRATVNVPAGTRAVTPAGGVYGPGRHRMDLVVHAHPSHHARHAPEIGSRAG